MAEKSDIFIFYAVFMLSMSTCYSAYLDLHQDVNWYNMHSETVTKRVIPLFDGFAFVFGSDVRSFASREKRISVT